MPDLIPELSPEQQLAQTLLQQLRGRKLRIARPGDMLTMDVQPGRVTVYLDADHTVCNIKVEPQTGNLA